MPPSVLLVEDEPIIRLIYADYFESAGIKVHQVCCVAGAKAALAEGDDIAFVLLDRTLPGGERTSDLLAFIQCRKEQGQACPLVIATSAEDYEEPGIDLNLTKMGMNDFMVAHRDARDFTKENLVSFVASRRDPRLARQRIFGCDF